MIGAIVITHNSEDVIASCIEACLRHSIFDVVIVDNNSQDSTASVAARYPGVRVVANKVNRGFAAAVNQGFDLLEHSIVLLLNPDAVLTSGLDELVAAAEEPGSGIAGGRLLDASSGRTQDGFNVRAFPTPLTLVFETLGLNRIWPGNAINQRYRLTLDARERVDVDQPAGAFLAIRREVWQQAGGFDESFYPVWFEDVDFCKRVRALGYRIRYVPGATARHSGGHSVGKLPMDSRPIYWYGSLLRYASKHFTYAGKAGVCMAVMAACWPRMMAEALIQRTVRPISAYCRVIYIALQHLVGAAGRKGESSAQLGSSLRRREQDTGTVVNVKQYK
ncbi:MAG: glycosyltransferase family 2 protein [Bryobacteraceae bacterium]